MSGIIYIVEEIQKRKKKESLIDALESIGLSSEDISNIDDPERILKEYQKWAKETFFSLEIQNNKIINPKFGDSKDDD